MESCLSSHSSFDSRQRQPNPLVLCLRPQAGDAECKLGHSAQARPQILGWPGCWIVVMVCRKGLSFCRGQGTLYVVSFSFTCSSELLIDTCRQNPKFGLVGQRRLIYDLYYHSAAVGDIYSSSSDRQPATITARRLLHCSFLTATF